MRFAASAVSLLLGTVLVGAPHLVRADDDDLSATLRGVMVGGLAAYDREDVPGTLKYVHTKSAEYDKTKSAMEEQFAAQDVTVQLVDFHYIGHDDEFAVARVHIKTTAPNAPSFTDNVIDNITLFKMENGQWKWWDDHVIGVEILE